MKLETVTPLILTFNEEANIERTLRCLHWAQNIIVVDSGSSDHTLKICASFSSVMIFERPFDSHAAQWNFGLTRVSTDWVLSLDADYQVSTALQEEISRLEDGSFSGYFIPFEYHLYGKALVSSILPPRCALFRRDRAKYVDDGHTQLLEVAGECGRLSTPLVHDDRKSFHRWFSSQQRYAKLECEKLASEKWANLGAPDTLRKAIVPAVIFIVPYCLFVRKGILDGWRGVYYAFQRLIAESLLSYYLLVRLLFGSRRELGSPPQ